MKADKLWCEIVLLFLLLYGLFIITQSFIEVWPTRQMHAVAQFTSGVALLLWGIRYFVRRPKVIVYAINIFSIGTLIGMCILAPALVIMALLNG